MKGHFQLIVDLNNTIESQKSEMAIAEVKIIILETHLLGNWGKIFEKCVISMNNTIESQMSEKAISVAKTRLYL